MSIYGKTKGTEIEKQIAQLAAGEAMGGAMYYALARIVKPVILGDAGECVVHCASHSLARSAKDYGLDDVAAQFIELGNQETNHSGFYATLNGKYPSDKAAFWKLVAGLSKVEFKGETNIGALAQKLSDMGILEAAEAVNEFAAQEKHHGEVTKAILEKYAPEFLEQKPGVKKYVCPLCGFEYEGDINSESADWKCPICGVAKAAFKEG